MGGGRKHMDFNLKFHTAETQLQSGTAWRMEAEWEGEKKAERIRNSNIYMYPREQLWRGTYNI